MADPLYRARQFFRGFRTALAPDEVALLHVLLTAEERAMFLGMLARDRRHSMDMVRWLQACGCESPDVLAAALLHDIGKGDLRVWDRVAFVLLGALGTARRFEAEDGNRLRRALWRLEHHAALGAARLGASRPRVAWLVVHHTDADPPPDAELALLMAADAAS